MLLFFVFVSVILEVVSCSFYCAASVCVAFETSLEDLKINRVEKHLLLYLIKNLGLNLINSISIKASNLAGLR